MSRRILAVAFALASLSVHAQTPISITAVNVPLNQDFNTLVASGTGTFPTNVPSGWAFLETGTAANSTYTANNGAANTGETYSYGSDPDRAFGMLQSGSLVSRIGAAYVNNTGSTITGLDISYVGEQWRLGANSPPRADRIDFQYSLDATSLADTPGTWVDVNDLDFESPTTTVAVGALNGNDPANRTLKTHSITGLNIPNGAVFWIRWTDFNAAGADDGLAVDEFSLTARGGISLVPVISIDDVSLAEGNSGTTAFTFTVSLDQPAGPGGVSYNVATADDTATVADNDYTALSLTGEVIPAGQTSRQVTVQVVGDTRGEANESFRVNLTNITGANPGDTQGVGTILNDDPLEIWQIQGSGAASPFAGQTVTTADNIVTAIAPNGFFIQTPDARADADPLTSNGIFVFTSSAPPASIMVGDQVDVTGQVVEFFNATQFTNTGLVINEDSAGNPLPTAVEFDATRPSTNPVAPSCAPNTDPEVANFECFEGMRVRVQNGIVGTANQRFPAVASPPNNSSPATDAFAEVWVTANGQRALRGPGFTYPGFNPSLPWPDYNPSDPAQVARVASVPVWSGNPHLFEVDLDRLGSIPNRPLTGGTRFQAEGVLNYEFNDYELWPTSFVITEEPIIPRGARRPRNDELSIASINVLRIYNDTAADNTVVSCRGAQPNYSEVATTAEYTRRREKFARFVISALRNPDIIALQEVENINVLNDLAQSIQSTPGGVTYTTALVPSNDVGGIDNGYLYRADRLTGVVVDQLGFNERLTLDDSCLHDRPPLRMRAVFQGVPFSLFNVHNRSLSGADAATTDGARIRRKRFEQADSIYAMLRSEQLAFPGQPVAVVGDFNAFEYSDGFVDSIGIIRGIVRPALLLSPTRPGTDPPALTNLVDLLAPEQRYSFIFQNSAQSLDHALVNAAALNLLGSAVYLRNNTDAPAHVFTEGPASCTTPYAPVCSQRVSDHDAVLVRFGDVIWRHGFEAED